MRLFAHGSGPDRKQVALEVSGDRLKVTQKKADGTSKKQIKELGSEEEARAECEKLARDLVARGYQEQKSPAKKSKVGPAASKAGVDGLGSGDLNVNYLFEADDQPAAPAEPVLPRLAPAPAKAEPSAPKKKGKKKKKKGAGSGDELDKRVIAAAAAAGMVIVGLVLFLAYDAFLKPPSIIGTWAGSMIEFEIGKPIIHTQYSLVLDEQKRASMTLQEHDTSTGTYTLNGKILKMSLRERDENGEFGEPFEREYKVSLGRSTLDLYDPASGKKLVQLLRFREKPNVSAPAGPTAAPKELETAAATPGDTSADEQLASLELIPKDGAFRVKYPKGWQPDTGSRPDNTYSWASFTDGSTKIEVFADIGGSLMSGSDSAGNFEEGSPLAPVHRAHEQYERTVKDMFSDYKESQPTLFKGSKLGEGRIAAFSASTGGLLGSKVKGYRITLLTNNRRVSVICQCPTKEFETRKPTFMAVARSVSR